MVKILFRYVASAVGIALTLLLLNITVLIIWIVQVSQDVSPEQHISAIANSLVRVDKTYRLTPLGEQAVDRQYQWAMLIDDGGTLIWSRHLPTDIPHRYSVSDVASFTRWYLKDYPVDVWRHADGLLVLGGAKGSVWKMTLELPERVVDSALMWIPGVLVLNSIAAVLLALLLGFRLFRHLKPIAKGIEDISENRDVSLPTGGLLGGLAAQLNKASRQLQRQEEALRNRDHARTRWIAGVSHDIRTPLSMVMGYASQLEENPALPRPEREQARIIRRQSESIKALINDLNLASKLEYNMQPLQLTSINLAVWTRTIIVDFLNNGVEDIYSIDFHAEAEAQSAVIAGDEKLLRRAVINLLLNSILHNPNGCTITVTVKKSGVFCVLSVADNGAGFTQKVLEKLKSADLEATDLPNHGLGLTIVRQIIKAHGGTTSFYNVPEGGCMAELYLPMASV